MIIIIRVGLIVSFLSGAIGAQPSLTMHNVQIKIGAVLPKLHPISVFAVGLEGELSTHRSSLRLLPYFDYSVGDWQQGNELWQWRLFSLGICAAHFGINPHSKAAPFWGGGLGFHYGYGQARGRADSSSLTEAPTAELDLALNLLAGVRIPLSPNAVGSIMCRYALTGKTDYIAFWVGALMNVNGPRR